MNGSALEYWEVVTFSDSAREELEGLTEGASLSAVGALHVETYEWNGETRLKLKLTADRVLALKPKPREAKPMADKLPSARAPARGTRTIDQGAVARLAASSGQATWAAPTKQIGDGPAPWERERAPINDEIPF